MLISHRGLLNSTALTNVGFLSAGLMLLSVPAMAQAPTTLPTGGTVIGGQATISQSGNTLTINQSTNNAAINWKAFSIGSAATTDFIQPGASSVAVNRVTGVDPSLIEGHLNANGQVVLVNPNGILFTKNAQVNVGGLVASTSGISEKNAIAGNLTFDQGSNPGAKIVNKGTITAHDGGLVALVAPSVINSGVITAKLGKVSLAAGDKWTLDLYGDRLVNFALSDKVAGEVKNSGVISADGGAVQITANVAKDVVSNAINMTGVIEASNISQQGGTIVLDGGDGNVAVSGTLAATGTTGGTVDVTGNSVALKGATVDVSGKNGGGTINIGGQSHGGGTLAHAKSVTVDSSSKLIADAIASGNGGDITVWSDGTTDFAGTANAKGVAQGGTIETSGHDLSIDGAKVNVSATSGGNGTWLLDPFDLTIDQGGATAIETGLAFGNVLVETTSTGADGNIAGTTTGTTSTGSIAGFGTVSSGTGDINLDSSISWSSANSLTLSAYDSINLNASISNAGTGNVVLRADNAGQGASNIAGQVAFNGSTVNTGGAVSIYYDTTDYTHPINYSGVATGTNGVTGYMLVNNLTDLNNVRNNLNGDYALGTNITGVGAFATIGDASNSFNGIFDGNGGIGVNYTIEGMTVGQAGASYVGLFADNAGTIRNLTLSDSIVYGIDYAAALAGENAGSLVNDSVLNVNTHTDLFSNYIGGMVGYNDAGATVSGATVTGNVTVGGGTIDAGGVIGINYGFATDSSFTGTVITGCVNIGGFAGANFGTIVNSFMSGVVINGGGGQTGGFVGENAGLLDNDGADNVNVIVAGGNQQVGGFVGVNDASGTITNSTAEGLVYIYANGLDSTYIGGFAGANAGLISSVSSQFNITFGQTGGSQIGGLVGLNTGTVTSAYVNTTVELSSAPDDASTSIGGLIGVNKGTVDGASGVAQVFAADNAYNVGGVAGYNQSLINNVTMGAEVSVGNSAQAVGGFVGSNNGTITNSLNGALVYTGNNAQEVGGFAGFNDGVISNAAMVGQVYVLSGASYVGGFVGGNYLGTIVTASAGVPVYAGSAGQDIAGFAGYNNGTLTGDQVTNTISVLSTVVGAYAPYATLPNLSPSSFGSATTDISVGDNSTDVGGFIGYNDMSAVASSDSVSGVSMTAGFGSSYLGGFVGENTSSLSADQASVAISAGFDGVGSSGVIGVQGVGGFVGRNDLGAVVTNSTATSTISTKDGVAVGGFAGWNLIGGTITNSTASTNIVAVDDVNTSAGFPNEISATTAGFLTNAGGGAIAGFLGFNEGILTNDTAANATVSAGVGAVAIGGFAGANFSTITNGMANGTVILGDGSRQSGGFAGYSTGTILNSTFNGSLTAGTNTNDIGGFIGENFGSVAADTVTNQMTVGGGSDIGGYVGDNLGSLLGGDALGALSVDAGSTAVGGFIGANAGNVSGGASSMQVTVGTNATDIGGFVGSNSSTINGGLFSGNLTAGQNGDAIGGYAGNNTGAISTGLVANTVLTVGDSSTDVGGYIGLNAGLVSGGASFGTVTVGFGSAWVGGFAGENSGTITGGSSGDTILAAFDGTGSSGVKGVQGVGGFVGKNDLDALVTGGEYTGAISTKDGVAVGGFAGWNLIGGTIVSSSATANVLAVDDVNTSAGFPNMISGTPSGFVTNAGGGAIGGFLGYNEGILTNDSAMNSNVTAGDGAVAIGGFAAANFGTITNAFQSGTVIAGIKSEFVGGLVGINSDPTDTGNVFGGSSSHQVYVGANSDYVGGYVGFNFGGTISGGNSTGTISAGTGATNLGGFAGANVATMIGGQSSDYIVTGTGTGSSTDVGGFAGSNTSGGYYLGRHIQRVIVVRGLPAPMSVAWPASNDATSSITNGTVDQCLCRGQQSVGSNVGGYIGANFSGSVTGGTVSGGVAAGIGSSNVGGFIGRLQPERHDKRHHDHFRNGVRRYGQHITMSAVWSAYNDKGGTLLNDTVHNINVSTNGGHELRLLVAKLV